MKSPNAFPWYPYHRIARRKIHPALVLRHRTAVHQASIGCPYRCSFCGVISAYGSLEKMESPARTEAILRRLVRNHGIDSVQFTTITFSSMKITHASRWSGSCRSGLKWWCEARIDLVLRYSDSTLEAIRRAGCKMIFFGAESGSDWVLQEMRKQLKTEQTLALARRIRQFDIIPEFSFVIGNPKDPERDAAECFRIRSEAEASESGIRDHSLSLHPRTSARADVRKR